MGIKGNGLAIDRWSLGYQPLFVGYQSQSAWLSAVGGLAIKGWPVGIEGSGLAIKGSGLAIEG